MLYVRELLPPTFVCIGSRIPLRRDRSHRPVAPVASRKEIRGVYGRMLVVNRRACRASALCCVLASATCLYAGARGQPATSRTATVQGRVCAYSASATPASIVLFSPAQSTAQQFESVAQALGMDPTSYDLHAGNVASSLATRDGSTGRPIVVYNADYLGRLRQAYGDASTLVVIAHELGHHKNGHLALGSGEAEQRIEELDADFLSGWALGALGIGRERALAHMTEFPDRATGAYPGRDERRSAIAAGWDSGSQSTPAQTGLIETSLQSVYSAAISTRRGGRELEIVEAVDLIAHHGAPLSAAGRVALLRALAEATWLGSQARVGVEYLLPEAVSRQQRTIRLTVVDAYSRAGRQPPPPGRWPDGAYVQALWPSDCGRAGQRCCEARAERCQGQLQCAERFAVGRSSPRSLLAISTGQRGAFNEANETFVAGGDCPAGTVRHGAPSGDGSSNTTCTASWVSSSESDCRVNVHWSHGLGRWHCNIFISVSDLVRTSEGMYCQ